MAPRREYGAGGISWLTPRKVRLRFYDEDGRRRTRVVGVVHKEHGGRSEAGDALRAFIEEVEAERNAPVPRTLSQAVTAYIEDCQRRGGRQGTIESYKAIAKKRLSDDLKAIVLSDLTPHHLDSFYGQMQEAGYASLSIRQTHMLLGATLRQAVRWTWLDSNPADRARPPKASAAKKPKLGPSDVWSLIGKAQEPDENGNVDITLAVGIFLLVVTGCRRGELCGLRWDDIDEGRSCIQISRQWLPGVGGQYVAPLKSETGADDGVRTVYVGPGVFTVLDRYRAHMKDLVGREPEGWLISYDAGTTPMHAKAFARILSELCKRAGVEGVTTHSFRKVTANELIAAGVDPDAAARRMGHTTQVMLNTYVKGADDRAVAAAGALEARLIDQGMPISELLA